MKMIILVLLCLTVELSAMHLSDNSTSRTVGYLREFQRENGGFAVSKENRTGNLKATSAAVRALKYSGGKIPNPDLCSKFVNSCFDDRTGGFADAPNGQPDATSTAIGLMAAVELKIPLGPKEARAIRFLDENCNNFEEIRLAMGAFEALGKDPPRKQLWIERVRKLANADGSFGKEKDQARDTGGAVVALLRMGEKINNPSHVLEILNAGQRKDGGFGKPGVAADTESTYRVCRAFYMLKAKPERIDDLKRFLGECRNPDGGYALSPGKPSSIASTYHASIILHWFQ